MKFCDTRSWFRVISIPVRPEDPHFNYFQPRWKQRHKQPRGPRIRRLRCNLKARLGLAFGACYEIRTFRHVTAHICTWWRHLWVWKVVYERIIYLSSVQKILSHTWNSNETLGKIYADFPRFNFATSKVAHETKWKAQSPHDAVKSESKLNLSDCRRGKSLVKDKHFCLNKNLLFWATAENLLLAFLCPCSF